MKVFFTFSAEQNLHRVRTVVEYWQSKGHEAIGAFSEETTQETFRDEDKRIKNFIDDCIAHSIVTVALMDSATSDDKWVRYSVQESHKRGHGLVAIHIHKIPDEKGERSKIGNDRFGELDKDVFFWQLYPTYRWIIDSGNDNVCKWVEEAYQKASLRKNP
jgi:hypothetical protein